MRNQQTARIVIVDGVDHQHGVDPVPERGHDQGGRSPITARSTIPK